MRITKVKIEVENKKTKMVLIHRNSEEGQLVLDEKLNGIENLPDFTSDIVDNKKNESFFLSILKKTVVSENPKQGKNTIRRTIEQIIDSVIKGKDDAYSLDKSISKEDIRACIQQKFRNEYSFKKSNQEIVKFDLPQLLLHYACSKNICVFQPYKEWIGVYLANKKKYIKKSIKNNRIVSDDSSNHLNTRRQEALKCWREEFDKNKKIDLTSLHEKFKLDDFSRRSLQLISNTEDEFEKKSNFNIALKRKLQEHQKQIFGQSAPNYLANRNCVKLSTYNLEIVKYIEHYFPIKTKRKMTLDDIKYYLNADTIKDRIKAQLINALRLHILQKKRFELYKKKDPDIQIDSNTLSRIKREDFFVFNLIEMYAFAANNVRNIVDKEQDQDILGKNDFSKSLSKDNVDNDLFFSFFGRLLSADGINKRETLCAMRGAVQSIRNGITHYERGVLEQLFKQDTFELCKEKQNKPFSDTIFSGLLKTSVDSIPLYIVEQLQTNEVLSYYSQQNIEKIFNAKEVSLQKESIPFAPGFKRIYALGSNLQQSNKRYELQHYLLKKHSRSEETKQSKEYPAYRFLMKFVYNYFFLNEFLCNRDCFEKAVIFVLKKNKEEADNKGRNSNTKYAFKELRSIDSNEDIATYMAGIHSLLVQEQAKKGTEKEDVRYNTENFIEKIFIKGFDNFLKQMKVDFLLLPKRDIVRGDDTKVSELYKSIPINCNHSIRYDDNAHISFFIFCKLLDAKHLSTLKNECIKFKATGRFEFDYIIEIIELCLLSVDNELSNERKSADEYKRAIQPFIEENEKTNIVWNRFYFQGDQSTPINYGPIKIIQKYGTVELLKSICSEYKVTQQDYEKWQDLKNAIEKWTNRRSDLHQCWVKEKKLSKQNYDEYEDLCKKINQYNWLDNKLHLVHLKGIHDLLIQLLSRLAQFVVLMDRDLSVLMPNSSDNELKRDKKMEIRHKYYNEIFPGFEAEMNGQIVKLGKISNHIVHFNYISQTAPNSLLEMCERLRLVMQYDRKLRNAVTKSIIHIFDEHGMILKLKLCTETHKLTVVSIKPKQIKHLKKIEIPQVSEEFCMLCQKLIEFKKTLK